MLIFICAVTTSVCAKEGLWIPATLKAHEKNMRAEGLEIPIEQLYNDNGTGLNNAVVLFGRGCTGELISSEGLVLTNHHCGYNSVQALSGPGNDYFASGYWAKNNGSELPCPGLTVTFVRRIENVTEKIVHGIPDTLHDALRDSIIAARVRAVEEDFIKATGLDATIKAYFGGNQYWVALTETYRDVRLVGFPPNGIGAFGGDVENWIWPRHTGDFSIFRVYAGADNKPADYNAGNKPYRTNQFLKLSVSGYKEGDFTMVYGFPGTTAEYISSYELKQVYQITDPVSIGSRTMKLAVWGRHTAQSRAIFLKYTGKHGGVANGWKKWQGEMEGLRKSHVMRKKQGAEKRFQKWAAHCGIPAAADLLPEMRAAARAADALVYEDQYNKEAVLGIELIQQAALEERMAPCFRQGMSDSALEDTLKKIVTSMDWFYRNYDSATDRDVFIKLMPLYFEKCTSAVPAYFRDAYTASHTDFTAWANNLYSVSLFASREHLMDFATHATVADSAKLTGDEGWQLYNAINTRRKEIIIPALKAYYTNMRYLNRLYISAQMAMQKDKTFYPDANLTLRLSYGKVKGLKAGGQRKYTWQTHLSDVLALDDTTSDIFKVPPKLKELYRHKDFGRWGVNGDVPVAFIATNHTTGGNSGSPVLNARGELIGTNFDRAFEGTMSDYYFDPKRCRNISVDIRYTLFIIDKFGGAGWLMNEMEIVK